MKNPESEQSIPPLVFLKDVTRPLKKYFISWLIVSFIWATDSALRPYLLRLIINRVHDTSFLNDVYVPAFLYVSTSIFIVSVSRLYDWIVLKLNPELKRIIADYMISAVLGHPHAMYQNHLAGSLSNKINDVVVAVPALITTFIDGFLYHIFSFLMGICAISQIDYKFSLALIIWLVIVWSVILKCASKSQDLADQSAEAWSGISGRIVDILSNMANVSFFASKRYEHDLFNAALSSAVKIEQRRNFFLLKIYAFQGISFVLLQAVCLWILIKGLWAGVTTVGDFSMVLSINTSLADCLWNISQDFARFNENLGKFFQGLRVTSFSAQGSSVGRPNHDLKVFGGEIVFDNVSFCYAGLPLLFEKKCLKISPGQKVGLVGHSGSGKSTFINLILKLFDVQDGKILIDGQDLSLVTPESLGRSIAIIPQDPPIFYRSLFENIRYGKMSATEEEVIAAAKKAFAHDFIMSLPEGYNTVVGERGAKLSGGQRQRIAIARAILKNAPILILDEATSALDSITEAQIQDSLLELMRGRTTIVIAHRLSTLYPMDRILVFNQGKVVEDGPHVALVQKPNGVYSSMWNAQTATSLQVGSLSLPLNVTFTSQSSTIQG